MELDLPPPTYHEATSRSPLPLFAPYIPARALGAACRVSRAWHAACTPLLWVSPVGVYLALPGRTHRDVWTTLLPALFRAEGQLRARVRVLQLPPRYVDDDDDDDDDGHRPLPPAAARASAIPAALPGAYPALQALSTFAFSAAAVVPPAPAPQPGGHGLKVLNVAFCALPRPSALADALPGLPALVLLDVSHTRALLHPDVLKAVCALSGLRILKAAGTGLGDRHVGTLAEGLGTRVWSLDLVGNELGDGCVEGLLDYCFAPPGYRAEGVEGSEGGKGVLPPPEFPGTGYEMRRHGHAQGQDHARDPLTAPKRWRSLPLQSLSPGSPYKECDDEAWLATRLARGDDVLHHSPPAGTGITHLYLSENRITSAGFARLLRTGRLRALDCGTVLLPADGRQLPPNLSRAEVRQFREISGAASLIPVLQERETRASLHWLRVSHHLVTGAAVLRDGRPALWELSAEQALGTTPGQPASLLPPCGLLEGFIGVTTLVLTRLPPVDRTGELSRALKTLLYYASMWEVHVAERCWHRRRGPDVLPEHRYPVPAKAQYLKRIELCLGTLEHEPEPDEADTLMASADEDGQRFQDALGGDFSFFDDERARGLETAEAGPVLDSGVSAPEAPADENVAWRRGTWGRDRGWRGPAAGHVSDDPDLTRIQALVDDRVLAGSAIQGPDLLDNIWSFYQGVVWPPGLHLRLPHRDVHAWDWSGRLVFRV